MNSIYPMNFFRMTDMTDTTDTTIWKPGFIERKKLKCFVAAVLYCPPLFLSLFETLSSCMQTKNMYGINNNRIGVVCNDFRYPQTGSVD